MPLESGPGVEELDFGYEKNLKVYPTNLLKIFMVL